jgi:multimeric flavodoxin WrbA
MNVLGISGSPHPNGNTAYAVHYALGVLQGEGFSTRFISLAGKDIQPCTGCFRCTATRQCQFDDDMTAIVEALRWCHGLILGSSVHFGLVSGQLKVMMDRCVVLRPSYEGPMDLAGKIGGGIACGGFRNGGQETTLQNIQTFLLQQNMLAINDGAGFSHAGGTIAGEAKDDNLGLRTVENLARNLALMLRRQSAFAGQ